MNNSSQRLDDEWWAQALDGIDSQVIPVGDSAVSSPVERLEKLLRAWAAGFAAVRPDVLSPEMSFGSRGLHPDECASFLRALDGRLLHADSAGYITPLAVRAKSIGGRYALCCKTPTGVTLNTEYLVQLGAASELAQFHGWPQERLVLEKGEFDLHGLAKNGRVILAMEAKCRVTGPDSLQKLLMRFLSLAEGPPSEAVGNAERKYRELLRLCADGPVYLWLVAAGARWPFRAERQDDRIRLSSQSGVSFMDLVSATER